jgi:hypothetical protein
MNKARNSKRLAITCMCALAVLLLGAVGLRAQQTPGVDSPTAAFQLEGNTVTDTSICF